MRAFQFSLCALLLTVGCNEVEDRLAWSPDGTRAALRVGDSLYLVDTNGNLSDVIASNVTAAAWLPDSRGLVLLRSVSIANWKDAESVLPSEEIAAVKTLAKALPDLLRAGLAFGDGDATQFFEEFEMKHPEFLRPALLYLFDSEPAVLREAMQKAKDPNKLEADFSNSRTTEVAEVSLLLLIGNESHVIERTLTGLGQPLPSPGTPVVAFTRGEALTVAPLDGSTNRVAVSDRVAGVFDWTPDGKALVYAVRQSDKDVSNPQLADINQRIVIDTNGALVAGDTLPLTMNASTFAPRVRCLSDGRVLFAGNPLQLPAPATAVTSVSFYLIDPTMGTNAVPVTIPSQPGSLPQDLASFVPNSNGRQIAIVESGSDAVAVLDVATGALEVISPKRGWKSKILPAWRGTDELYFAALPESSSARPELFRWRKGSAPQVVSTNWPAAVVNSLLEKPSER